MHYVLDREGNVVVKVQGIKGVESVKKELEKTIRGQNQWRQVNWGLYTLPHCSIF